MTKINVTWVGAPWSPPDKPDYKIWNIAVEGEGEPQKTDVAELAVIGEHEAELSTTKAGKPIWRRSGTANKSNPASGQVKQFKADPESRDSIEKQKSLAEAVNFVNAVMEKQTEAARLSYVLLVANKFNDWLKDPSSVDVVIADDDVNEYFDENQPPIENYEDNM